MEGHTSRRRNRRVRREHQAVNACHPVDAGLRRLARAAERTRDGHKRRNEQDDNSRRAHRRFPYSTKPYDVFYADLRRFRDSLAWRLSRAPPT
jgi:hypothetical protein